MPTDMIYNPDTGQYEGVDQPDYEPPKERPPEQPSPPQEREPEPFRVQEVEIPRDAEVTEYTARGTPFTLKGKDGETYFGEGSTPYEMGFRTESERIAASRISSEASGIHEGPLVGENTIIVTRDGKPLARYSQSMLDAPELAEQIEEIRRNKQYLVPVRNADGKEVLLTPKQYERLTKADSPQEQLSIAKDLKLVPKDTTLKEFTASREEQNAKIGAENFVSQQEVKRQGEALNQLTKYKEGDTYFLGRALAGGIPESTLRAALFTQESISQARTEADYLKASPQGKFKLLQLDGTIPKDATFNKLNPDGSVSYNLPTQIETLTTSHLSQVAKDKGMTAAVSAVWQALTPWDETAGQTFLEYSKGYPARVKESYATMFKAQKQPSQVELKAQYEAGQAGRALPLWAKLLGLGADPQVVYNAKTDKYTQYVVGVAAGDKRAALVAGVGAVVKQSSPQMQKLAQRVGAVRPVKTIGHQDVGMTEAKFAEFLKARQAIPNLSPEAFKDAQKVNTKIDWGKVQEALKVKPSKTQSAEDFARQYPEYAAQAKLINDTLKSPGVFRGGVVAAYQRWLIANPSLVKPKPAGDIKADVKTIKLADAEVRVAAATILSTALQQATQTQTKTRTALQNQKAFQNAFESSVKNEVKNITDTKLQNAVEQQIQQATQTQPATKTQTKTETKTVTQVATATRTATKPQTQIKLQPATQTKTQQKVQTQQYRQVSLQTARGTGGRDGDKKIRQVKIKLPKGGSDKDKRKAIQRANGAIGWRQGELHGKDRWDVITNIYKPGQEQYVIVMGDKPQGATIVKGPGSAFRTAQMLYGKKPLPRTAIIDQPGLFTTRLDPLTGKRIRISFEHDANISKRGTVFPLGRRNNAGGWDK